MSSKSEASKKKESRVVMLQPSLSSGPQKSKSIKFFLIILAVLVVLAGTLVTYSFLTPPILSRAQTAVSVDLEKKQIKEATDTFTEDVEKIYCVAEINTRGESNLTSIWYYAGEKVGEYSLKAPGAPLVKLPVRAIFLLKRQANQKFFVGKWQVKILVDSREVGKVDFKVEPKMKTYQDFNYRFSVNYPEDWQASTGSALISYTSPHRVDNYSPNFNVSFQSLEEDVKNLEGYMSQVESYMAQVLAENNYQKVNRSHLKIGDLDAQSLTYTWVFYDSYNNPYYLKSRVVILIDNKDSRRSFSIYCHSSERGYQEVAPYFDKVIESFKLL